VQDDSRLYLAVGSDVSLRQVQLHSSTDCDIRVTFCYHCVPTCGVR